MKYILGFTILVAAAFGTTAFGQCSDADKKALEAFDRAWSAAGQNGDKAALTAIYANDYVGLPAMGGKATTIDDTMRTFERNKANPPTSNTTYDHYLTACTPTSATVTRRNTWVKEKYKLSSFKDSCPTLASACEPFEKQPPPEETKPEKPADPSPTPEPLSVGSAAQTGDPVEVEIRCPISAQTVSINWKNHLEGYYIGGVGGPLDFEIDGGDDVVSIPFKEARRIGQNIHCSYRMFGSQGGGNSVGASYKYKVKREIVSCGPFSSRTIKCRVKP